jgi:hypothetical protein
VAQLKKKWTATPSVFLVHIGVLKQDLDSIDRDDLSNLKLHIPQNLLQSWRSDYGDSP